MRELPEMSEENNQKKRKRKRSQRERNLCSATASACCTQRQAFWELMEGSWAAGARSLWIHDVMYKGICFIDVSGANWQWWGACNWENLFILWSENKEEWGDDKELTIPSRAASNDLKASWLSQRLFCLPAAPLWGPNFRAWALGNI